LLLNLYQLKKGAINLIAIYVEHLNMFIIGDRYISDIIIYKKLHNYMKNNQRLIYLQGILLYDYLGKSMFIKNIANKSNFSITKKMLENIGVQIIL
jgi:hypothetical protein